MDRDENRPHLQSLAQGARALHLKQIRGTLLTIGIFTLIFNAIDLVAVPTRIRGEMAMNGAAAANAPAAEAIAFGVAYTIIGTGFALGILFLVFGVLVHSYPVPITIASLVVYILTSLVCVGLSLITLGPGSIMVIIFRIAFTIALARSVKTAFAYRKDLQLERAMADDALLDDLDVPAPAPRPRPALEPNYRDEHGIQADVPRVPPRYEPAAEVEPVLLRDEHMQAGPPRAAPPTFASENPPDAAAPAPIRKKQVRERSTELIGQEFTIGIGRPWTGFVMGFLVFASILAIGTLTSGWIGAAASLFTMAIWCLVFFTRRATRSLRFAEGGLEFTHPSEKFAYGEILDIFAPERGGRRDGNFPIHLLCEHSHATIPASVHADSEVLFRFLRTQPLGERAIPVVPPMLRDFLKQQLTVHGPEDIYVYRPRLSLRSKKGAGSGEWLCLSLVPAGVTLFAIGVASAGEAWIWSVVGFVLVMAGILLCLLALLRRKMPRATVKNWQKAALIVGPDGLALVQGDVTGELRWHELHGVDTTAGMSSFGLASSGTRSAFPGLTLVVAGATITIADIYHWPLAHVKDRIEEHWGAR